MSKKIENEILKYLQKKQYAKVEEVSTELNVSASTVRRKLTQLQQQGLIKRKHGGANLIDTNDYLPNFTFRAHQNSLEKKKIALAAIKLIKNGDLIFLDGSTTAYYIAEYLSEFTGLRVVTNGIDTLSLLSKKNVIAYSTGGIISKDNRSVLVGQQAVDDICAYHADVTFFSASSIKQDGKIYDCFESENVLRKYMLRNTNKRVLLCDQTKFGKTGPFYLCQTQDLDCIVTDFEVKNFFTQSPNCDIIKTQ